MRSVTRRQMLAASGAALVGAICRPRLLSGKTPEGGTKSNPAGWKSFRNGPQLLGLAETELPDSLSERWSLPALDGVSATAAIAKGRAYVADLSGNLRCVDLASGKVVWTYASLEDVPKNSFAPAFKSSPAVTETRVYLGDEMGLFHAIDRQSGRRKWTFQTEAEIISSPTIDGENVLFGSYDNSLYCLNGDTGESRWQVQTQGYVHCTPAVSEGTTFIAGCDEHLRGIEIASGKEVLGMPIGTYLIASPATREGILYFGTYAAEVLAIDWRRKKTLWTYKSERNFPIHSSAAVTDDLVIVGGRDQNVHALDRRNGKQVWVFSTRAHVDSSPVVCGDRVYVGSSDRNLYVLDLATGTLRGKHYLGDDVTASPAIAEGALVIGGDGRNAKIFCFGGP